MSTQVMKRTGHGREASPRARLLAAMPVTERRLTLAGIETAVLEGGDGPPIVLLHGQGEFAATWLRTVPALTEAYSVIAPDLPGHGASGLPDDGALDVERALAWLGELIERTCVEAPVIAGHLLGGAIAARFAAAQPRRVRRLILVDALGLGPFRPAPSFALAMIGFVVRPTPRSQERLFRGCFADYDGLRVDMAEQWDALADYALECAREPRLQTALRAMMPKLGLPAIPSAELERIQAPTTLIWGRDDLQARLRFGEAASARYGWPLHIIDGAADDPAVEQPEAFMRAFRAALNDRGRA